MHNNMIIRYFLNWMGMMIMIIMIGNGEEEVRKTVVLIMKILMINIRLLRCTE